MYSAEEVTEERRGEEADEGRARKPITLDAISATTARSIELEYESMAIYRLPWDVQVMTMEHEQAE
jgi:hypothetical protein